MKGVFMRVSVLMGIYNCESTLPIALDSLLEQTFSDWKCIMCDDGSTDNTYSVAKKYVDKYPRHFYLIKNNVNQGLNATLNKCLSFADTEYIARMDGDDISLPLRFEKEVSFLDEHKEYDIVSTPMILFDKQGDFKTGIAINEPTVKQVVCDSVICHAPCMIRTKAIKSIGGYSTKKATARVEDVDLWIRLYANGSKCYNLSEPLYKMLDDRNAVSRRKFKYRVNSTKTRISGCKIFNLDLICYLKCFSPIIIGLLPKPVYIFLHRKNKR